MKERPILFSAPMVRAILEGRKTQTRRVVKPQPDEDGLSRPVGKPFWHDTEAREYRCPYGQTGDRLWVRETCQAEELDEDSEHPGLDGVRYLADGSFRPIENSMAASERWGTMRNYGKKPSEPGCGIWRQVPSIHMPRWASRILLEIVAVRVERLNDISEADAMTEGAEPVLVPPDGGSCPHVEGFRELWESINGDGSWATNPWVWAIEFRRVS